MGDAEIMAGVLARIDATMTSLAAGQANLAERATVLEGRVNQGDTNTQAAMDVLENRRTADSSRMADVIANMTNQMVSMQAALVSLQTTVAAQTPAPATPPGFAAPAANVPTGGGQQQDPWLDPSLRAARQAAQQNAQQNFASPAQGPAPRYMPTNFGGDQLKSKDFMHIDKFDGDLAKFPDWSDRMSAKFSRTHEKMSAILKWAEERDTIITERVEKDWSEDGVDLPAFSLGIYDILMERTGSKLFDKRRNAGQGRGLEFWRTLRRDFGMESNEAQAAKLQLYMKPCRCTSVLLLGEALDRWESLGREVMSTLHLDDKIKHISLRELIPKNMVEMMNTQASLKDFPDALLYVRRQVAEQRHSSQVSLIQRGGQGGAQQAPVPMDMSVILRQIAALRGETYVESADGTNADPANYHDTILAALHGKSYGKAKGKGQQRSEETRECYQCGKVGHLARDCRSAEKPKAEGKGDAKGKGKGNSKGKGWNVGALEEVGDEGITLGCLTSSPMTLNAVSSTEVPEAWEDFECIEAIVDSGAAECVCGPQHFTGTEAVTDSERANAGAEYITAAGEKLFNFGEKTVRGQTEEGETLSILFQVTSVDKVLIAVSKLTAAGHTVNFEKHGGVIIHGVTGRRTEFTRKNNVYYLRIWVRRPVADKAVPGGTRR
jgi:hypothetical protein